MKQTSYCSASPDSQHQRKDTPLTPPQRIVTTAAGLALMAVGVVSCTPSNEVGELEPVTFDDLEDLFHAVDDELDCPDASSDHYGFPLPNHDDEFVHGYTCGNSVIMAHADDPAVITEIQNAITTVQGGPIPTVHNRNWLVVDITEVVGDTEATDLEHPASRDLEELAATWGAAYSRL